MYSTELDKHLMKKIRGELRNAKEGMHLELLRLASFKQWPETSSMMPNVLSRHGFYYTGTSDEVECFSCGCKLKDWMADDDPVDRHKQSSLNCRVVMGESENIALPRKDGDSDFDKNWPSLNDEFENEVGIEGASGGRFLHHHHVGQVASKSCASMPHPQAHSSHTKTTITNPASVPMNMALPDYRKEHVRRETFRNWPGSSYISPDELTKAGFICLGIDEQVQCAFCHGIIKSWNPGDDPFNEHQKKFPACPFVKDPRIGRDHLSIVNMNQDPKTTKLRELGIETDLPKTHSMALELARLESFKNWPVTNNQKAAVLAKAGFYYNGTSDCVKCYWCNGGLKNWLPQDDPWVEHAKYFPSCGHLKNTIGQDFISYVQTYNKAPDGHVAARITRQEVLEKMNSTVVKSVLEMGFDSKTIENILHYRMAVLGNDFENAETLVESYFRFMDKPPSDFPLPYFEENNTFHQPDNKRGDKMEVDKDSMNGNNEDSHKSQCRICKSEVVDILFLPCKHLVCCHNCSPALSKCPICQAEIKAKIKVIIN